MGHVKYFIIFSLIVYNAFVFHGCSQHSVYWDYLDPSRRDCLFYFCSISGKIFYTVFFGLKRGLHSLLISLSPSLTLPTGNTVFFDPFLRFSLSLCTHTVSDLQLLEQGACAEITLVYWKLMRHGNNHVSIYSEPLLFSVASHNCINFHATGWLKSHQIKNKT